MNPETRESPEHRFRQKYISANEICTRLKITPSGLTKAIERGNFPEPLEIDSKMRFWERDAIESELSAWQQRLFKSA